MENLRRRAERVISLFEQEEERKTLPQPRHRDDTLKLLYAHIDNYAPHPRWPFRRSPITLPEFPKMNPILTTTLALAVCTVLSLLV